MASRTTFHSLERGRAPAADKSPASAARVLSGHGVYSVEGLPKVVSAVGAAARRLETVEEVPPSPVRRAREWAGKFLRGKAKSDDRSTRVARAAMGGSEKRTHSLGEQPAGRLPPLGSPPAASPSRRLSPTLLLAARGFASEVGAESLRATFPGDKAPFLRRVTPRDLLEPLSSTSRADRDGSPVRIMCNVLIISNDEVDLEKMMGTFTRDKSIRSMIARSLDEARRVMGMDFYFSSIIIDPSVEDGAVDQLAEFQGTKFLLVDPCVDELPSFPPEAKVTIIDKGFYGRTLTEMIKLEARSSHKSHATGRLLDSLPSYVFRLDSAHNIQKANRPFPGFEMDDFVGAKFETFINEDLQSEIHAAIDHVFATPGESVTFTHSIMGADGKPRVLQTTISPTTISEEKVIDVSVCSTDITAITQCEKMEAEMRVREFYITHFGHMFRNPQQAIALAWPMVSTVLGRAELSADERECVGTLHESLDRLSAMMNQLSEYEIIKDGKFDLELNEYQLSRLVDEVRGAVFPEAEKKGVTIDIEINPAIAETLYHLDVNRVKDVLLNLVSNAVKYTESGGRVCIHIEKNGEKDGQDQLLFAVEDTGVGIREEHMDRLFKPFTLVDEGSISTGGIGLGLATAQALIHKMGSEIVPRSEFGKGSVFSFALSLEKRVAAPAEAAPVAGLSDAQLRAIKTRLPMLVVDDSIVIRKGRNRSLQGQGFTEGNIQTAKSREEAVGAYRAREFWHVFMDVIMGADDAGLRATEEIRAFEAESGRAPAIISGLSGNASPADRDLGLAAGMNHYNKKPMTPSQLSEYIDARMQEAYAADLHCFDRYFPEGLPE
jgi:signal transduction histidine kinase/CheY-like chemotaxis protein